MTALGRQSQAVSELEASQVCREKSSLEKQNQTKRYKLSVFLKVDNLVQPSKSPWV